MCVIQDAPNGDSAVMIMQRKKNEFIIRWDESTEKLVWKKILICLCLFVWWFLWRANNRKRETGPKRRSRLAAEKSKITFITLRIQWASTRDGDRWAEKDCGRDKKRSVSHRRFSTGFSSFGSEILFLIFNVQRCLDSSSFASASGTRNKLWKLTFCRRRE